MKTSVLDSLVDELEAKLAAKQGGGAYKHSSAGTPIATGFFHGPGGLLSFPGVDQDLFHTIVGNKGIMGQLPAIPTFFTDPTFYTLTGVPAGVGSQPPTACGDPPYGGLTKGCLITAPLGRYEYRTPELDLNRLGQRVDRADPTDLRMIGSPTSEKTPSICLSSSSRSVTMTTRALGLCSRIHLASSTMTMLLPLPWLCQMMPLW